MPEFSPALLRGESGSDENQSLWLIMTITLPETNSLLLKMDGWNTIVSFWDGLFSGVMLVSGSVRCQKFCNLLVEDCFSSSFVEELFFQLT